MNKKLAALLQQYNLTVFENMAYGVIQGYEISVRVPNTMEQFCYIHASFYATEDKKNAIAAELAKTKPRVGASLTAYGLKVAYPVFIMSSLIKNLPVIFQRLTDLLKQYEAPGAEFCPYCGQPLDPANKKRCSIDGFSVTLNADCVGSINKQIDEENRAFANAPNNYIQGICGALIGGVVGAGLVIGFYFLGYVASVAALIAVMLGAFLYRKFGGKPNTVMIVIVSVVSLIFILLGFVAANLIEDASILMTNDLGELLENMVWQLQNNPEGYARAFYTNLAMLLVFTAIGIGVMIFSLAKQIKRPKNIS